MSRAKSYRPPQYPTPFTATVQRDAKGVDNKLKRSVLIHYITALFYFYVLKEHHGVRARLAVYWLQRLYNNCIEAGWTLSLSSTNDVPVASI
jgi:hypothetical protein